MRAIIGLLIAFALHMALTAPTAAGPTLEEQLDYFGPHLVKHLSPEEIKKFHGLDQGLQIWAGIGGLVTGVGKVDARVPASQIPNLPVLLETWNDGFGVEPGEPNPKKTMKRTFWRHIQVATPQRIVAQTFGSELDTALAVYTGTTLRTLKQVAFDDDTPLPGGPTTHSLVDFDAKPGTVYHIQVGSKTGVSEDVRLDIFSLAKTGGITAFLLDGVQLGSFPGADWVCRLGSGGTSTCVSPRFVVHNASKTAVTVTASTGFGPGFSAPAPFTLGPGETTLKSFTVEAGFDVTTVRTLSSSFVFEARAGAKLVGVSRIPGLVTVAAFDTTGVALKVRTVPLVQTAAIGEPVGVPMAVTNEGTVAATGCMVANSLLAAPPLNVVWYRLAASGKGLEPVMNPLFDVAPGQTVRLVVSYISGTARIAEPTQIAPIRVECTNADRFSQQQPDAYGYDVTTLDSLAARLHPLPKLKGNVLAVKKSGTVYKLTVVNDGADATLTLTPSLIAPGGDPAGARYKVAACLPSASDKACLRSTAESVEFDVKAGKSFTVKVAVKAPTKNPGFDPDLRRLVVTLREKHEFFGPVIAGSVSVALKKR